MTAKNEEARLRRVAARAGYLLRKSRRRDPDAVDSGLYAIIDPSHGGTIHPMGVISAYSLDLHGVRAWLEGFASSRSR